MPGLGKLLIVLGLVFLVVGGVLLLAGKIPFLGRLPGDIHLKRGNWEFHFPLATSLLLSLLLTAVLWLVSRFWRR